MEKDKEDSKALKNPSMREKTKDTVANPTSELEARIWHLESQYKEEISQHEKIREQWHKHYSHLCLFFLITGLIAGFIVGAIVA